MRTGSPNRPLNCSNDVPLPREVEVLELGPAERVDALVTMNNPGAWILGEVDSDLRSSGMGIVVDYARWRLIFLPIIRVRRCSTATNNCTWILALWRSFSTRNDVRYPRVGV